MSVHRVSAGGGAGRTQGLLFLLYPIALLPVFLAYLARYAFDNQTVFYAILALAGALGVAIYWMAMESAVSSARYPAAKRSSPSCRAATVPWWRIEWWGRTPVLRPASTSVIEIGGLRAELPVLQPRSAQPCHSHRSAIVGSTAVARRAGM